MPRRFSFLPAVAILPSVLAGIVVAQQNSTGPACPPSPVMIETLERN
jgi:hypothetical protein